MRVLFVDDERRVFEGVGSLISASGAMDVVYAPDSAAALREMEAGRFDLVITETRLAGNDATATLRAVKDQFPSAMRIVLGDQDAFASLRQGVSLAHQFKSNPAGPDMLRALLERASAVQQRISAEPLKSAVGKVGRLPAVPRIYSELTRAMGRPNADTMEIASIVSQDPAMSVKVLQLVNSAFFARGSTCTDVSQAVMRLGLSVLRNLVLSVEVFQPGGGVGRTAIDIEAEHRHALRSAAVARKLLEERSRADDAFTGAIIHDIGRLLLARKLPEPYVKARKEAEATGKPMIEAEQAEFGFTHAAFGAYVLGMWGVPYAIVEAVAFHHDPLALPGRSGFGVNEALYVADHLSQNRPVPGEFLAATGYGDRVEEWQTLMEDFAEAA